VPSAARRIDGVPSAARPAQRKNDPGDVGAHGVRPCGKKVFANKSGIASGKKITQTGIGQMKTANPLGNIPNQTKSSPIDNPRAHAMRPYKYE
jgi:hypothetical protein